MVLARWQSTIVDEAGNIQDGASVTVQREVAGAPLASLFSDRDGAAPLGNPITADSEGFAAFHVAGGAYRITATKGGFSRVWRYVAIGLLAEQDEAVVEGALLAENNFSDVDDDAEAFDNIKQDATEDATGVSEWSTTAEVRAAGASDDTVIRSRKLREASALVTLTDAATVAVDWTAGINFSLTLITNRILGNPTNGISGTFRTVFVISDGGPDELTFGSEYGGAPPTLDDITTTKGYLLTIYCRAAGQFIVAAVDGSPA
jgi:hypothetical protein